MIQHSLMETVQIRQYTKVKIAITVCDITKNIFSHVLHVKYINSFKVKKIQLISKSLVIHTLESLRCTTKCTPAAKTVLGFLA